jgi:6-phosphogluconate dehydrogenase
MQKALTQVNARLANAIGDLSGLTGQTIVRAILAGERDSRVDKPRGQFFHTNWTGKGGHISAGTYTV